MNIRANNEKGFSLIELLVVVAIIGVLAAVGVVGYQGYIDSTKESVTKSNAKALHQWFLNTKTVKAAGISVDPNDCNNGQIGSDSDMGDCLSAMVDASGPFGSFKNAYDSALTAASTISLEHGVGNPAVTCDSSVLGNIIVRNEDTNAADKVYQFKTFVCTGATPVWAQYPDGNAIRWD